MSVTHLPRWVCQSISQYNVFLPEEDDYDDNPDELEEPAIIVRRQRYASRLYVVLLLVFLYALFYAALSKPQSRTILVSPITLGVFTALSRDYDNSLSCPCSNITVLYGAFVNSTLVSHPVCQSVFVSESWITALYFANATEYHIADFRTSAHAQFRLLADLCSFAADALAQNQFELDNSEFVSVFLLTESQVTSAVHAMRDLFANSLASRIGASLSYLRISTRANYLVSALNTNHLIFTKENDDYFDTSEVWATFVFDSSRSLSVSCTLMSPTSPTGFFTVSDKVDGRLRYEFWVTSEPDAPLVKGFFAGCLPFEALLPSTLDCLFDPICLRLLCNYFPGLQQFNWSWNTVALRAPRLNVTVSNLLSSLFVENQTTNIDYSKYFQQCLPVSCTYTSTDRTDFSYTITLFVSLYGGLIIILRLLAPFLTLILFEPRRYFRTTQWKLGFVHSMQRVNLFKKAAERSARSIRQQKLTTWVYLLFLTASLLTLLLYSTLSTRTTTVDVAEPSLDVYTSLVNSHGSSLRCPCTSQSISYGSFLSVTPNFHPVCSSDFVSESWLTVLRQGWGSDVVVDWRNRAPLQFQLLADLCRLAEKTVGDALERFLARAFVTSSALFRSDFAQQINIALRQFILSTQIYFDLFVETTRLLIQVDQPLRGVTYRGSLDAHPESLVEAYSVFVDGYRAAQFRFRPYVIRDINDTECVCASKPHCRAPAAIYETFSRGYYWEYLPVQYLIPGSYMTCSTIESLRVSTLECLYASSPCLSILLHYIQIAYDFHADEQAWFEPRPLLADRPSSPFQSNNTFPDLISEVMVERWDSSSNYEQFYQACAPSHCTHVEKVRTRTFFAAVLTLISSMGGASVSLRLVIPRLVELVMRLFVKTEEKARRSLKATVVDFFRRLYTTIVSLSIFPLRHFGQHTDRTTAKQLSRWATRLHVLLLIIGVSTLALYSIVRPQTLTKTFDRPSLIKYTDLYQQYGDALKCSCASIASMYRQFVNITADFHQVVERWTNVDVVCFVAALQICSSGFVSDEWQAQLGRVHLLSYPSGDYRRILLAHVQFLQGLCELSNRSVNSTIEQFLSSLFVTVQLLPADEFDARLSSLLERTTSSAPATLDRLLRLTGLIQHGNGIISTYGTNYEYLPMLINYDDYYAGTRALSYDDGCECGLAANCTTNAKFTLGDVPLRGLKVGCTASEAFRLSTLECFYEQSCLNLLQRNVSGTGRLRALNRTMKRLPINATIDKLISNVFVDDWPTSKNYTSYFASCSPLLCTYTYTQQSNPLYTITLIFGLQGGLSIVLKWISPRLVRLLYTMHLHRTRRATRVQPIFTVETTQTKARTSCFAQLLCWASVVGVLAMLILFSIFFAGRHEQQPVKSTVPSPTDMPPTVQTTPTTIDVPLSLCQPTFQMESMASGIAIGQYGSVLVADFNSDRRPDIVYADSYATRVYVMLNLGNGTFEKRIVSNWSDSSVTSMDAGDSNGDTLLDLFIVAERYVYVLLGNGNGTFRAPIASQPRSSTSFGIAAVSDLNEDGRSDLLVRCFGKSFALVLLANGNGTFTEHAILDTGRSTNLTGADTADFNNDNHTDIAVVNRGTRTVGVFLGDGQGNFSRQMTSITGGAFDVIRLALGDFNSDGIVDAVVAYAEKYSVGLMLGHGNGTFGVPRRFYTPDHYREPSEYYEVAVIDFNIDGHQDIIFHRDTRDGLDILLGNGRGEFQQQSIFQFHIDYDYTRTFLFASDLNGDGCDDVVHVVTSPSAFDILLNTCACRVVQL